ncbi:Uncharacterised protein [Mycobacteroides abscessus]|nr:Uncharacterised protein [Mycobacteroides abscessus]
MVASTVRENESASWKTSSTSIVPSGYVPRDSSASGHHSLPISSADRNHTSPAWNARSSNVV